MQENCCLLFRSIEDFSFFLLPAEWCSFLNILNFLFIFLISKTLCMNIVASYADCQKIFHYFPNQQKFFLILEVRFSFIFQSVECYFFIYCKKIITFSSDWQEILYSSSNQQKMSFFLFRSVKDSSVFLLLSGIHISSLSSKKILPS